MRSAADPRLRPRAAAAAIRLIVQADDFGMCHAVNEGVVEAHRSGILTQASMMTPCPWFAEAAELARRHAIAVGLHSTLTCEWDAMRWRPLTSGRSLVRADGTFHETVERARAVVRTDEALAELVAQVRAMTDRSLEPSYIDTHMGVVSREAYERLCALTKLPFMVPTVTPALALDSLLVLSPRPAAHKRRVLLDFLGGLGPGVHLIQAHPAVASRELRALVAPGSPLTPWTEDYRTSDLAALTDPEVAARVLERGVALVSVSDLDGAPPVAREHRPAPLDANAFFPAGEL